MSAPTLHLWLVRYERAPGERPVFESCYGAVVAAESADAAEAIAESDEHLTGNAPTKLLGTAAPGVERGVLLHDFL